MASLISGIVQLWRVHWNLLLRTYEALKIPSFLWKTKTKTNQGNKISYKLKNYNAPK